MVRMMEKKFAEHILTYSIYTGPVEDCSVSNGGCDQICTPTATGRDCSCLSGYSLGSDVRTCSGMLLLYLNGLEGK